MVSEETRPAPEVLSGPERSTATAARGWHEDGSLGEVFLERLGRIEARLGEVQAALARLDDGSYGRCGACGSELGGDLLTADPAAGLCGACAGTERR